ncbi:hypothetical protein D3C79_823860 [compost metagenome]
MGGLEEVALGIDVVDAHGAASDLPAHHERGAQIDLGCQLAAVTGDHFAQGFGHQYRCIVERGDVQQVGAGAPAALFEQVDHRLRGGEVAGGLQDDQPLAGHAENEQLAKRGYLVDAGIGA